MRVVCAAMLGVLAMASAQRTAQADATTTELSKPGARLRGDLRLSFAVTDKRGVPDAIRAGGSAGGLVYRHGLLDVSADAVGVFGFSEKIGHSYRLGVNLEVDRRLPTIESSAYAAVGVHYFVSRAAEDRTGMLPRLALGFRIRTGPRTYVGFEPLAIERIPLGDGVHTPVRTRWAWEMTFLSVGFRP